MSGDYSKEVEEMLNDASDMIASTLDQPKDPRAWDQLLIYCPREAIERRLAALENKASLDPAGQRDEDRPIWVQVLPIGTAASEVSDGFKHTYALRASGGWVYKGGSRKGLWCPVEDAADVPQRFKDAVASFMAEPLASGT